MNGDEQNKKKLRSDAIFGKINQFVTLQKDVTLKYNAIFKKVTEKIISILKQEDEVFKKYYQKPMHTGSFYKQTRVGKPEEFDLNLILSLPDIDHAEIKKGRPGFAKIRFDRNKLSPVWKDHKILNKWLDSEYYLDQEKLRRWFEGVVTKSLGTLQKTSNNKIILPLDSGNNCEVKITKSGPAFTLSVSYESMDFAVDLVPVLEFSRAPPLSGFQPKQCWHLVPKPLRDGDSPNQNWRYSFYSYEQEMLKNCGKVKPVIRHIKKLRDTQNWSILVSYHIETLFFHALSANIIDDNASQTALLVFMLKELSKAFKSRSLNYFWDKTFNVFGELTTEKIVSVQNRLDKIIKEIEADPANMTQYFLTKEEQDKIRETEMSPIKKGANIKLHDTPGGLSSTLPLFRDLKSEQTKKIVQEPQNGSTSANEIKALKNKILSLETAFKDFKDLITQKGIDQTAATAADNTETKELLSLLIKEMKQLKSNIRTLEIKIDQTNDSIRNINSRSTFFDTEEIAVPLAI